MEAKYKYIVKVLTGKLEGKLYKLVGSKISIGRGTNADIVLQDTNASRIHAYFEIAEDKARIIDNNSTNGIFVNKKQLPQSELKSGDKILIGDTLLEFLIVPDKTSFGQKSITIREAGIELKPSLFEKLRATLKLKLPFFAGSGSSSKKRKLLFGLGIGIVLIIVISNKNSSQEDATEEEKNTAEVEDIGAPEYNGGDRVLPEFDSPSTKRKHIHELYGEARVFHDVGKYYEALQLLEDIMRLDPAYQIALIKRNKWTHERDTIGQKLLEEGIRAYNNKYYDLAISYFQKVLDFVKSKDHELYKKAENGIVRVEKDSQLLKE